MVDGTTADATGTPAEGTTTPATGSDNPATSAAPVADGTAKVADGATPAPADTTSTDWRSAITDPEAKEFATRLATPADAVKVALDLRKANGSMTRVPGKDASADDIAKFNKLIGIPAAASEYKFDIGREATEADKVVQAKLADVFLANRVPAEAAPAISKAVAEIAQGIKDENNRVALAAREATTATLRKELGAEYDAHLVLADRAVKQWGNPGFNEFLNKAVDGVKIGDHPDFVRVFGAIGRRMGEGGFIGAVGGTERQSLQAELNTLYEQNPPGSPSYAKPEVQRRVIQINEALHGTATI